MQNENSINYSAAQTFKSLPPDKRQRFLENLTERDAIALLHNWAFWARPNQLPPSGDWFVWLILAGRGFGKTRTGAEWVIGQAKKRGASGRIALAARTPADVRDTMIEGESGILAKSPPDFKPIYEPSKRRLIWPNGCRATTFSSYKPDELRGPQHTDAWCDELAAWYYLGDCWSNLMLGLRLGADPRCVVTTTPKPVKLLRELRERKNVAITSGSSYENLENLAPTFRDEILGQYEGTTLGRQEIYAELLDEAEGALWKRDWILHGDAPRGENDALALSRVVVSIDPATTNNPDSDETGITVNAIGHDGRGYLLADISGRYSPDGWARAAIQAFYDYDADTIIAEANQGGDMVAHTIKTIHHGAPIKMVHASRSKQARAEPVAALYEQGRMTHVGAYAALEDELTNWEPNTGAPSPNRLDALVWGFTELFITRRQVAERKLVGM